MGDLDYGKIKIIEISVSEKIIPENFENAFKELEQAQKYWLEGDYDKVVAHCRNLLDLIPTLIKIDLSDIEKPSFIDKIKKFLDNFPDTLLTKSKRENLEKIIKSLWDLTTIPHHSAPLGYFNRADVQFILTTVTLIFAYIGRLFEKTEK